MELVESYEGVEKNVRGFNEDLESSQDLQQRLSTFTVWYYIPSEDAVGPSKFIGYRDMTAEKYVQFSAMHGEMDGGKTEDRLGEKQWFRGLDEGTSEYVHVKSKVDELVQKFGKSAKTSAQYRAPIDWALNPNSVHMRRKSLNTILYGPPGTGKTYATTRRCVEICDGQAARSDEAVRDRYRELVQTGRVVFITFHQSYGYEEFVEGLRPKTGSGSPTRKGTEDAREENGVGFRLVASDGVLKRIANRARSREVRTASIDLSGRKVFKMALGNPDESSEHDDIFSKCIEDGCVLLGSWGRGEVDLSDPRFDNSEEMFYRLREIDPRISKREGMYQSLRHFRCQIKSTDLIIVPDRSQKFRAIGEITGEYEFVPGNKHSYCHRRKVHWHWWDHHAKPISELYKGTLTRGTIRPLRFQEIRWDSLHRYIGHAIESERKPHILVIDEINRANVSKVMGELVTLLEEDKREGAENQVVVTLPHSGDRFTLPSNLHILGTMNTADRSIALLDTALRRRFEFEEMSPEPEMLEVVDGIDLPAVLRAMNERLEYLIDRDHLIGHAWLMRARTREEVDRVMRHKVIPLIAEYFYDDWRKVRAVLGGGDGFVQRELLQCPPDLDDDPGEDRYRWTIRKEFSDGAYERLISGREPARQSSALETDA